MSAVTDEAFEDESSATPSLLSAGAGGRANEPDDAPVLGAATKAPGEGQSTLPEFSGATAAAAVVPSTAFVAAAAAGDGELPVWAAAERKAAEETKRELLRVRGELEQANAKLEGAAQRRMREDVAELARKLVGFYATHNVSKTHEISKIAKDFVGREDVLNRALRSKYGKDLATYQSQKESGDLSVTDENAGARSSQVVSTASTRVQSVSPPPGRLQAPRTPNRPSSALGSRPRTAKIEVCKLLHLDDVSTQVSCQAGGNEILQKKRSS
jgi:hypothetical protein